MDIIRRLLSLLSYMAVAIAMAGCSMAYDVDGSDGGPEYHAPIDIILDGKVSHIDNRGDTIAVGGLKVTLLDAGWRRIDSTHTNSNGRFLIEHSNVNVGRSDTQRHIYVEISDERDIPRYKTMTAVKLIHSVADNRAILTMADIIVEEADDSRVASAGRLQH